MQPSPHFTRPMRRPLVATLLCLLAAGVMGQTCSGGGGGGGDADGSRGISELQAQLDALAQLVVPVGGVLPFAGPPEAVPPGFLLCDGSAVSRIEFAALFAEIGTAHGVGDGASTFDVPDYRGRLLRGVDSGVGRDPESAARSAMGSGGNAGDAVGSVQGSATALPVAGISASSSGSHGHVTNSGDAHSHSISGSLLRGEIGGSDHKGDQDAGPAYVGSNPTHPPLATPSNHSHGAEVDTHDHTPLGGDLETRPVNAYVNWIIKF